jgi:hypothetical protein
MTTQTDIIQKNHHRAVRFFWGLLIGATIVSLFGNVTHAMLAYLPRVVVQVGAAAVPPVVLLAAVHGIALAVRAGASGRIYRCAVGAVAVIGVGAFTMSFLALRDLMETVGYSSATAWIFPAIIDTAVAVSTMMLVALGDKPVRRSRPASTPTGAEIRDTHRGANVAARSAKSQVKPISYEKPSAHELHAAAPPDHTSADADLASDLVASRVTTQPVETVVAVLTARRAGASINAAAKVAGINYRTAQRIAEAAEGRRLAQAC